MEIKYRKILKLLWGNPVIYRDTRSTWFSRIGNKHVMPKLFGTLKELYDKYTLSGSLEDYNALKAKVDEINKDLEQYEAGYSRYKRNGPFDGYGTSDWQNTIIRKYPYINDAIGEEKELYEVTSSNPTSGDSLKGGWHPDNKWLAETNDRTPSGFIDSIDDPLFKDWNTGFKEIGIDLNPRNGISGPLYLKLTLSSPTELASQKVLEPPKNNNYSWGNLKEIGGVSLIADPTTLKIPDKLEFSNKIDIGLSKGESILNKGIKGLGSLLGNPKILDLGRLAGLLINNKKIYEELRKGIKPTYLDTYYTGRQVVGDEADKLGFYRRAILGLSMAALPIVADSDRQMAYRFELKRIGDDLRAQGDLVDNKRIMETSELSSLHLDANKQRETEIHNANVASENQANSLLHNLGALELAANWASVDNLLKSFILEKLKKLERLSSLLDLEFLLTQQELSYTDSDLLRAKKKYESVLDKYKDEDGNLTYDPTNAEIQNAIKEWKLANIAFLKRQAQALANYYLNIRLGKSGVKITKKSKDDLLYKSTKDVVEHFRKMSKIASDALNRKQPKILKLTSHPKGSTRKYLLGGVAPFGVFTPVVLGGETSTSTYSERSGKKSSSEEDDKLDLLKELFKKLSFEGLPSDTAYIYKSIMNLIRRQELFGNELSTEDILTMYVSEMYKLGLLKFNKEQFDKTLQIVNNRNATSELAIDDSGMLLAQNVDTGKIESKSYEEVKNSKGKLNPLTNGLLLELRKVTPSLAFNTNILAAANNATSMTEIAKFLKSLFTALGSSEQTIEGYTKHESNQIRKGLELLTEAPAGDYKFTLYSKDLLLLAKMALNYLISILPNNMATLLSIRAQQLKVSPADIINYMIGSTMSGSSRFEFDAVTGKASKDTNENSKEKTSENSSGLAFALGLGPREVINFNIGTSKAVSVLGIKGVLLKKTGENLGLGSTLQDATKSLQGGYLDWSKATFGGSRLNPGAYSHIILNDSTIMGMDLPYKTDINGNDVPDFLLTRLMEEADEIIKENNITDINKINEIYLSKQLPPKYDSNGNLNTYRYKRFAAILATLDELALKNKESILSDEIELANDVERDLYENIVKSSNENKKYSLDDGIFGFFKDELYKGTIFIPYSNDIAFAALSSGLPFKQDLPDNTKEILLMQYAEKAKTYKTPDINLTQLKNN